MKCKVKRYNIFEGWEIDLERSCDYDANHIWVTGTICLYGSYARGDFGSDSDVDIMILLDISDFDLKAYSRELSYMTYDFNMDNDLDIKPIAKNQAHFEKWVENYPFYSNIQKEGVVLYGAA